MNQALLLAHGQRIAGAAGRAALTLLRGDATVQKALAIAVAAALLPSLIGGSREPEPRLQPVLIPAAAPVMTLRPPDPETPLPDVSAFAPGVRVRVFALGHNNQPGEEVGVVVLTRPVIAVGAQRPQGIPFDGAALWRIEGAITANVAGHYEIALAIDPQHRGITCQIALRVGRRTLVALGQEYLSEPRTIIGGTELAAGTWPVSADIACDRVDAKTPAIARLMLRRPTDMALAPAALVYRAVAGDTPQEPFGEPAPPAAPQARGPVQPTRPRVATDAAAAPVPGAAVPAAPPRNAGGTPATAEAVPRVAIAAPPAPVAALAAPAPVQPSHPLAAVSVTAPPQPDGAAAEPPAPPAIVPIPPRRRLPEP